MSWTLYIDDVFHSAINAPTTGNTYDAFVAAAKALGANETPVGCCSLVSQAFRLLMTTRTIFSFPAVAWYRVAWVQWLHLRPLQPRQVRQAVRPRPQVRPRATLLPVASSLFWQQHLV
jgi:hypothetical protein